VTLVKAIVHSYSIQIIDLQSLQKRPINKPADEYIYMYMYMNKLISTLTPIIIITIIIITTNQTL
jgi:hypothetical protein